jgi:hypothetical protein
MAQMSSKPLGQPSQLDRWISSSDNQGIKRNWDGGNLKLRHLFSINLIISIFFGLTCSQLPHQLFKLYGLQLDEAGVWAARLVGGSILGYATLIWFGRGTASIDARKAIAIALLVQDVLGLMASLEIQFSGVMGWIGWSNPILNLLLSLGYAYFVLLMPSDI